MASRIFLAAAIFVLSVISLGFSLPSLDGLRSYFRGSTTHVAQKLISPDQCTNLKSLPSKKIAIIGAGSAGASTAYYLAEFFGQCANLEIDVYERNSYVGGRSTTVNVYDDPSNSVELGASIFVAINQNLVAAYQKFNLSVDDDDWTANSSSAQAAHPDLGVWDGSQFVFTMDSDESLWTLLPKLFWKYGLSPVRTRSLVTSTVNKFLQMYKAPYFPWTTLTGTVQAVDLDSAVGVTGTEYLTANSIIAPFSTDLIQASTRVNYAQNLDQIHGLETMVCMAISGAMSVNGGNWQIFNEMLKYSQANVLLNTTVSSVAQSCHSGKPGAPRFKVQSHNTSGEFEKIYDDVVIAAPYQYSDIALYDTATKPAAIEYVQLHVTLFATPYSLSPDYFGTDPVPFTVMTTLPGGATSAANGTGPEPFFSVSTLSTVTNPKTLGEEFVYKIFSPQPVSDSLLASLLLPASTASHPGLTSDDLLISWKYEKIWHSYPYEIPRTQFEEFVLDDGLWYTAGIESFISTMETSSLSGMNVAANMKNSWGYPYNITATTMDEL